VASIKAPDDRPGTARAMLRQQLEHLFAYEARWIDVDEKTPVLRLVPGEHDALQPSTAERASGMARHGQIQFGGVKFANIASAIGSFGFGRGVVDETGLTGTYDVELTWTPGDRASLLAALMKYGLSCDEELRTVKKLRVTERNN
jgi:uncharacterized protein (TIGR03435 family)